jgi:predicted unusual protein kinase regulating ubiquinone biosynthesis (AarF/ABC1/UbiB family)
VVVAAVAWRRTRGAGSHGAGHAVTHRTSTARGAQIGAVGLRSAGRYAAHRARRTFADAERRDALDVEFQMRTAEEVAATLGNMKGAMMKIGQMASYLDQGLPEPVRDALSQLRSDAPPMAPELAARVIEEELGAPPDRLFAEWDPVPIASASIGQVHRALTHDDRAVAVKVQYPGIAGAIEADLVHANLLFGGLGMAFPGLEPGPLVEELRARLVEELDYGLEARNQQEFAAYYRDHPFIHVPTVVTELSTSRVLTTDLAVGESFDALVRDDQARRDAAAEAIYRFVFRSLYRMRIFNGDPHPGNYLFGPDGRVTFLDSGLVKRFAPSELQVFSDMVEAMSVSRDTARYRRIVEDIGLLRDDPTLTDDEVAEYFGHFYDAVAEPGPFTITSEWASALVRRVFDQSGEHAAVQRAANVPPSFVIIQRINLGLYAILGELEATADWRAISEELWPFVDGPPATPMGEAEAEWLARRGADHGLEAQPVEL